MQKYPLSLHLLVFSIHSTMVHIQKFPTEVLDLIFQQMIPSDAGSSRMYLSSPSRGLFPFNTASVCARWHNILKSRPDFWQLVAIDLADDPNPFLDTFTLFHKEGASIEVVIFSSGTEKIPESDDNDGDNERKALENSRACLVYDHLEPALPRCRSISFYLIYQSSLPHSAEIIRHPLPHLTDLSLLCTVHDLDESQVAVEGEPTLPTDDPTTPHLAKLTLTGYSFMEILQVYRENLWQVAPDTNLRLSITHFKFRKSNFNDPDGTRSFSAFLFGISCLEYIIDELSLSDLSIDYRPLTDCLYDCSLSAACLKFDNVSSDFITSFLSAMELSDDHFLFVEFKNCSIPRLGKRFFTSGNNITLNMENIPYHKSSPHPLTGQTRPCDESISNAIEAFNPTFLRMRRCDGVCDDLFYWFIADKYTKTVASQLLSLEIVDCRGFTSRALCTFIQDRHKIYNKFRQRDGSSAHPFPSLEVSGRSPMLARDDEKLLLDMYCQNNSGTAPSRVMWRVEHDGAQLDQDNYTNDFFLE